MQKPPEAFELSDRFVSELRAEIEDDRRVIAAYREQNARDRVTIKRTIRELRELRYALRTGRW